MQDLIFLQILHFLYTLFYCLFLFFHTETNQCSLQFRLDDSIFFVAETAFCQFGFRPFSGSLRSLCIDVFFPLPGGRQYTAGSVHHREHSADTCRRLSATVFQYNMGFPHTKCGTVIAVSWQDRQIPADCPTDQAGDFPFIQQSFSVAEQFTGMPGTYVSLKETLRGFRMILDGECDEIPESCFLFAGTIDEVFEKAKALKQ